MIVICSSIELIENFAGADNKEPDFSETCIYGFVEKTDHSSQNNFKLYAKRGEYELEKKYEMQLGE